MEEKRSIKDIETTLKNCSINHDKIFNSKVIKKIIDEHYENVYRSFDYELHVSNLDLDNEIHIIYGQYFLDKINIYEMFTIIINGSNSSKVIRTYELLVKEIVEFSNFILRNLNFDFNLDEIDFIFDGELLEDKPDEQASKEIPDSFTDLVMFCIQQQDFEDFTANFGRLFSGFILYDAGCPNVKKLFSLFDMDCEPVLIGIETVAYNFDLINGVIQCDTTDTYLLPSHDFNEIKPFLLYTLLLNSIRYSDKSHVVAQCKELTLIKSNSIGITKPLFNEIVGYHKALNLFPKNTLSHGYDIYSFNFDFWQQKDRINKNVAHFFSVVRFDTSDLLVKEFIKKSLRYTGYLVDVGNQMCFSTAMKEIYFEDNDEIINDKHIFESMLYYFIHHAFLNDNSLFNERTTVSGYALPDKYLKYNDFLTLRTVLIDKIMVTDMLFNDYQEQEEHEKMKEEANKNIFVKLINSIKK
ncbi:hypothetical protein H5203_18785 [Pseudoalteromonas sp. SG41-1]|uniref:hypothetical protein n=1 Tax=Pseudoalteromonas sp. SG41-1 TaxID=2760979 RepID=UPI001603608E|nr:hypothetical protein [Pseudoalteromonas sp. SG41-1]MBB1507515.1 hypothetical protein [Pseudoalteromonas sp. SG41-1]